MFAYYLGWILFAALSFTAGYIAAKMIAKPEEWFD